MRQITRYLLLAAAVSMLIACKGGQTGERIAVMSREEGSGTRSAFVELFDILDANKNDNITLNAEITNNTAVMLRSVQTNASSIGYVSMGSLSDVVKAVKINGVEAKPENVVSGTYPISRPFLIAKKGELTGVAGDFVKFMLSDEGQKIVRSMGYISESSRGAFTASQISGRIVVAGSTSVAPVMEKLKEAYLAVNPNVAIEIQASGSSAGIKAVQSGIADIGMSSRSITQSEIEQGLITATIALDGIAVILNNQNSLQTLNTEQVKGIFAGAITNWKEVR